jgi:hypothetical protein
MTDKLDRQGQLNAGLTFDEDLRLGPRRPAWPFDSRLETRSATARRKSSAFPAFTEKILEVGRHGW